MMPDLKHMLWVKNPKYETMTEIRNVPVTKTWNSQCVHFDPFVIWYSYQFRFLKIFMCIF